VHTCDQLVDEEEMEEQLTGIDNRRTGKHRNGSTGERSLGDRSGSNSGSMSSVTSSGSGGSTRSSGGVAGNVAPAATGGYGFPSLSKIFTARCASHPPLTWRGIFRSWTM
jgi:hypothetical protein